MSSQKQPDPAQGKLPTGRKPWKKKTPVEVVLDQINRLRDNVAKQEEDLKQAKRQLQKLEEVRKVPDSTWLFQMELARSASFFVSGKASFRT